MLRKNRAAWAGELRTDLAPTLDSSLKKNTAFIKKARLGLNQENLCSLLTDIRTLSLEKYLSEVVSASAEGVGKVKTASDIAAAVEFASSLHQRFASPFTTVLAFHLVRALSPPPASHLAALTVEQREKDESSRIGRQRILIRVVTELWLVGVFRTVQDALDGAATELRKRKMDDELPVFCLRELLANDKDFINLGIATSFVKVYAFLLEPVTTEMSVPTGTHVKLRAMIEKYYDELATHLQSQNRHLHRERSRLEDSTVAYGTSPSAREASLLDLQKLHDKQVSAAHTISEALKLDSLVLQDSLDNENTGPAMIRGFGGSRSDGELPASNDLWDDEEQRRFYEVLLDLTQVVPSDMLCEEKSIENNATPKENPTAEETMLNYDDGDLEDIEPPEEDPDVPTTTIGVKVHNLLVRLPEMTNRETIDKCAVEFSFLNSKASRNRLIKALLDINIARTDLLPYYARLIATLNQYLNSIATSVITHLHRDCRRYTAGQGLKKDIPKRLFNIRYLSELVKFGIVPIHITFHCMRIIMDNFTKYDVEILASMLEHCGRYLLRSQTSAARMENVLSVVMRKAQNTPTAERTMLENAFYYVSPPQHAGIPQLERPPMELYIDKLMYGDLSTKSSDRVLRCLKKLNWNDDSIIAYLRTKFTSPWDLRYSSIGLMALLLSGLSKLHPDFMVQVIDTTVEDIRLGLEENIFRENQQRVATVKFLGELYNNRLVDSKLVLGTLYMCLSIGTPSGAPIPGGTVLDPAHDFFRTRLILTLLEACATSLLHGSLRSKVDLFLCYFQYYLKTKTELTKDIEYDILRLLKILRPALRLCANLEEAASELDEALRQSKSEPVLGKGRAESDSSDSTAKLTEQDLNSNADDADTFEHEKPGSDDEQEFVLLEKKREQDDLDKFAEEDLDREFSRLMNESLEVRKADVKRPFEISLPRKQVAYTTTPGTHAGDLKREKPDPSAVRNEETKEAVNFTFLSKKNKPRSLALPSDSPLALNNAAHRIAEEKEKQTIRDLTLKYEVAQSREEIEDGLTKAGIGVKILPTMLAGQKGGTRSGSMFKMGAR